MRVKSHFGIFPLLFLSWMFPTLFFLIIWLKMFTLLFEFELAILLLEFELLSKFPKNGELILFWLYDGPLLAANDCMRTFLSYYSCIFSDFLWPVFVSAPELGCFSSPWVMLLSFRGCGDMSDPDVSYYPSFARFLSEFLSFLVILKLFYFYLWF